MHEIGQTKFFIFFSKQIECFNSRNFKRFFEWNLKTLDWIIIFFEVYFMYMITCLKLGMGIVANADLVYVRNVKNFIDDLL